MSPWMVFSLSALAVILAGGRLSRDGDTIADRTGLGGAWIGAILVAGASSLPELSTGIAAVRQGHTSLAMGDLFGSCMANILILAVADLCTRQMHLLTRVTVNHVLVGLLATTLMTLAAAGIVAHLGFTVLGLGWGTIAIGATYFVGMRVLHANRAAPPFETHAQVAQRRHGAGELRGAVIGFVLAAAVILFAAPYLADSAADLAQQLGVASGFVGMVLLAITTSLPEAAVSLSAVRAGSYDLAVGNLLGSNCFNMVILLVLDGVDGSASLLAGVEPGLLVGALFSILLTALALLAILNRSERRVWVLEQDGLLLVLTYLGGLYLTYRAGR